MAFASTLGTFRTFFCILSKSLLLLLLNITLSIKGISAPIPNPLFQIIFWGPSPLQFVQVCARSLTVFRIDCEPNYPFSKMTQFEKFRACLAFNLWREYFCLSDFCNWVRQAESGPTWTTQFYRLLASVYLRAFCGEFCSPVALATRYLLFCR